MHTISKETGLDKEYYGHETEYLIHFTFLKQKAKLTVQLDADDPNKCRIVSDTDGYHWLQFFLSQIPKTDKMIEWNYSDQVARCKAAFIPFGIDYEQEDKESAFLTYTKPINEEFVKIVADIIEPRFANRERFFE